MTSLPELTPEEAAINYATCRHIFELQRNLLHVCQQLQLRCLTHDQSKLVPPEVSTFAAYTPKLKDLVFGSEEYKQCLAEMKPALDHHYARNSHHPEHYTNGVDGMNLFDLVEMFCDWAAAAKRTKDGSLTKSIDACAARFNLSPQLVNILHNTVEEMPA